MKSILFSLVFLFVSSNTMAAWLLPDGRILHKPRRVYINNQGYGTKLFRPDNAAKRQNLGIREVVYHRTNAPGRFYLIKEGPPVIGKDGKAHITEKVKPRLTLPVAKLIKLKRLRAWADRLLEPTNTAVLYALERAVPVAEDIAAFRGLVRKNLVRMASDIKDLSDYGAVVQYRFEPDEELDNLLNKEEPE